LGFDWSPSFDWSLSFDWFSDRSRNRDSFFSCDWIDDRCDDQFLCCERVGDGLRDWFLDCDWSLKYDWFSSRDKLSGVSA